MAALYLIAAALAGSTLGALFVHLCAMSENRDPLITLHGLKNPIAEFQRPVKDIFQALWRFCWALGFGVLHVFLWGITILVCLASMFGSVLAAFLSGVTGVVMLLAALPGSPLANRPPTPEEVWAAWYMLTFATTYGLSAYVGCGLVGKEKKEG